MGRLYETDDLEALIFSGEEDYVAYEELSDEELQVSAEDLPALEFTLELSDGRILEYEVFGVFICGEKEYVALHPKTDTEGEIHLMELTGDENDDIRLLPVEEDEMDAVTAAFYEYFESDQLDIMEEIEIEDEESEGEEDYDRD